ncbi:MAG: hypothetical protein J0M18_07420 [Ignavibacteria bacterium]|nr:hypothetical protein [Ignavibacteria bacterium]
MKFLFLKNSCTSSGSALSSTPKASFGF